MIYTDGVHLISDEREEVLHAFALSIGMHCEWHQDAPEHRHPHYDLTTKRKLNTALAAGAVLVSSRELVSILRRKK